MKVFFRALAAVGLGNFSLRLRSSKLATRGRVGSHSRMKQVRRRWVASGL
jgi:hypothetical protein